MRWLDTKGRHVGRAPRIGRNPWAWEMDKVEGYRADIAHRLAARETIMMFANTDMNQSTIRGWVEAIARS